MAELYDPTPELESCCGWGRGVGEWADFASSNPLEDVETVFSQYEDSDAPAFLKQTMRRFRQELLDPPTEAEGNH